MQECQSCGMHMLMGNSWLILRLEIFCRKAQVIKHLCRHRRMNYLAGNRCNALFLILLIFLLVDMKYFYLHKRPTIHDRINQNLYSVRTSVLTLVMLPDHARCTCMSYIVIYNTLQIDKKGWWCEAQLVAP